VKCTDFLKELNEYWTAPWTRHSGRSWNDHLALVPQLLCGLRYHQKTIQIYKNTEVYDLPDELRTRLQQAIQAKCQAKKKASGHKRITGTAFAFLSLLSPALPLLTAAPQPAFPFRYLHRTLLPLLESNHSKRICLWVGVLAVLWSGLQ